VLAATVIEPFCEPVEQRARSSGLVQEYGRVFEVKPEGACV